MYLFIFKLVVKNIFFKFFLCGRVFRTHKRECAKFAPFWMKKKNIGTPHVIKSPFLSVNKQNIFQDRTKMFTLLCGPRIGFYQARKLYWSWNNGPIGIRCSTNEPIG